MRNLNNSLLLATVWVLMFTSSCLVVENKYEKIAPGIWRGTLTMESGVPAVEADVLGESIRTPEDDPVLLPFLFEVAYDENHEMHIELINGEERLPVDRIVFNRNRNTAQDTFVFYFDVLDSYLRGIYKEDIMDGEWVRANRENYRIPFVAHFGETSRFPPEIDPPSVDFSGRWAVQIETDTDHPFPAVGIFEQTGKHATGTFLTEKGDYRYLAGDVYGRTMRLSTFDGSHAYLFEAKMQPDGSILGTYWSGLRYKVLWNGKLNPEALLSDPDSIIALNPGTEKLSFAYPDENGKQIDLNDPEFQGKPKIIQMLGTWCPNCRDETNFLASYFTEHSNLNIAVIGLAFESYKDDGKNRDVIRTYREKMEVPYPILLAGHYDYDEIARKLPLLKDFIVFPTMIILDKNNQILRIHTGFSGPATPDYEPFTKAFDQYIQDLSKS
ncbi:MAG: TlpA family protein disulfide reductase [Saprospiraceae bacterium]|nr:TlpA family protein disulfide reductase [Saprospiraceae bacterium]